jgi:3-deoxy-manno-octulosonate cytidylyltransferase (CMP-KDO synthetase)
MSRVLAVIPARMGSSRFPGKPLALLHGRPMIEHVYRRTAACALLDDVVIATCDEEIEAAVSAFGGRGVMTSPSHERASDRVAEVASRCEADVVVMIQGDEPMVQAAMIEAAVTPLLSDPAVTCTNLVAPIRTEAELRDRNTIKVVMAAGGQALYFSREPIPALNQKRFESGSWFKQVCVIGFRRAALARFAALPQGPLERAESVDMLRFLENGMAVHMVPTTIETHAVDTPDDLRRVETLMAGSPITAAHRGE